MESTNNPVWKKTWVANPALNASKNGSKKTVEPEMKKHEQSPMIQELNKVLNKRQPGGKVGEAPFPEKLIVEGKTKIVKPELGHVFKELTAVVNRKSDEKAAKSNGIQVSEIKPTIKPEVSMVPAVMNTVKPNVGTMQELTAAIHRRQSAVAASKISFLFQFNKYVIVPILTDWLPSKDLIHLETSLTNHSESKLFLGWMQSFSSAFLKAVVDDNLPWNLSLPFFHWIEKLQTDLTPVMRNLTLTNNTLTFIEDLIAKKKTHGQYLTLLKKVRSLTVRTTKESSHFNYLWGMLDLPCLEELKIIDRINLSGSIKSSTLWDIVNACSSLRVCHLSSLRIVTDFTVQLICLRSPFLSDLNISLCHCVTGNAFLSIAVHCRELKTLNISHIAARKRSLHCFAFHLRSSLTSLIFNEFGDDTLTPFLYFQGVNLAALDVSASKLSDVSLSLLGSTALQLTDLNVLDTSMSMHCLVEVVQLLPMLRGISVDCTGSNSGSGIDQQNPLVILSIHCFYLKRLCVQGSFSTVPTAVMTSSEVMTVDVKRPPLPAMPASALDLLGSSFSGLTTLHLIQHGLTDDVLAAIAFHTTGLLTDVNLTDNPRLSDFSVCELVQKSPLLRVLCLNQCTSLTDSTLFSLSAHGKRLTSLDIGGCDQMKKEGIAAVLDRLPALCAVTLGPSAMSYLPKGLIERVIEFNSRFVW